MTFVSLTDGPESRIVAILEQGRGITGSTGSGATIFSPHSQDLAVAAGTLRRSVGKASLDDPGLEGPAFDRSYHIEWISQGGTGAQNEYDNTGLETVRVELQIGVLAGAALADLLKSANSETAAILQRPKARAIGISKQVARALMCCELYQAGGIDPSILLCEQEGLTTTRFVDGGRLIATTVFRLTLELDLTKQYG